MITKCDYILSGSCFCEKHYKLHSQNLAFRHAGISEHVKVIYIGLGRGFGWLRMIAERICAGEAGIGGRREGRVELACYDEVIFKLHSLIGEKQLYT